MLLVHLVEQLELDQQAVLLELQVLVHLGPVLVKRLDRLVVVQLGYRPLYLLFILILLAYSNTF